MAKLWIFNPWNDLALAADVTHYTPPPLVRELELAGQYAMLWIAAPNDFALIENLDSQWYGNMASRYPIAKPWSGENVERCVPWGWSKALGEHLKAIGADPCLIPQPQTINRLRQLSHRRLTVTIHQELGSPFFPAECHSVAQCEEMLRRWNRVIAKAPWSSTGRGVFSSDSSTPAIFLQRCSGIVRQQGSVMVEPLLDVESDFAMLFHSDGQGKVTFSGYSLFSNRNRAYTGNMIMPEAAIEASLSRYVSPTRLMFVRQELERILSAKVGNVYSGYLGVDMFIYRRAEGDFSLNPCVEVNLRPTMGVVAMLLRDRFLPPGFEGIFSVGREKPHDAFIELNPPGFGFHFAISPLR